MFDNKTKDNLENLLKKINPLQRMINSDGLNESFKIIKDYFPELKIHEYSAGEQAEDWIVPQNWSVKKGFIKDKDNKIVSGDPEKIKKVLDTWKFSKDSRSSNPNWLLIDTQA